MVGLVFTNRCLCVNLFDNVEYDRNDDEKRGAVQEQGGVTLNEDARNKYPGEKDHPDPAVLVHWR